MDMFIWTLSDAFCAIVGLLLLGVLVVVSIAEWFKRSRCKHDGETGETQSCESICRKCGKNLGFIGNGLERIYGADKNDD